MKTKRLNNPIPRRLSAQAGVTIPEIMIVFIILAIVAMLAMPQMIASKRLFSFSAVQREMATYLRESRQFAMSEREVITFRYDDTNKKIVIYGGTLGAMGNSKNRVLSLSSLGVSDSDVVYGRPTGASVAALGDGTNITNLSTNIVEIEFQPDGSVLDVSDNPVSNALFFYHAMYPAETAFALSILGSGGRVKVWNYSAGVNSYVE